MNYSNSYSNFAASVKSQITEQSQSKYSSALHYSPGANDYSPELTAYQDRALRSASSIYNSQEMNYEKIKSALTNQLESLREQIRLSNEIHKKEIERVCEDYELKLEAVRKDKEKNVRELCRQIEETEEAIRVERGRIEQEKAELEDVERKHEEEVKKWEEDIREVEEKIEVSRGFLENKAKSEVKHLKNLISSQLNEHKKGLEQIVKAHDDWTASTNKELAIKDSKIETLQREILTLQAKILEQTGTVQNEILQMQSTLKSSQKRLSAQKSELKKLTQSESQAKIQESLLSKEHSLLDRELKRVKNDNKRLNDEIKKLEALVYGKNVIYHKNY